MAQFPHLHMTLRENGKVVDPFRPDAGTACGPMSDRVWDAKAREALAYRPGEVIALGLTDAPVKLEALEKDTAVSRNRNRIRPLSSLMCGRSICKKTTRSASR